ncbi:MAG: prepilin-type N-terminal cleavage/methylation domain-containing protein [Opitutales bacterium]
MKLHRPANRARHGFTLVEVLISMVLVAVAFAGATAALIQGNRIIGDARHSTRVAQVIQSQTEALRTETFDDLLARADPTEEKWKSESIALQGRFASRFGDVYTMQQQLRWLDHNHDAQADQIEIYVEVKWNDSRGRERAQNHFTRFTRDGLNDYFYRAF